MNSNSPSPSSFGTVVMSAAALALIATIAWLVWVAQNQYSSEDPTFAGWLVYLVPLIIGAALILIIGSVATAVSKSLSLADRKRRYLAAAIGLGTLVFAFLSW